MQRVLVIGISGAGKSTFSRALGAKTGLPIIHLDTEFWQPGWKVTPTAEWNVKVAELIKRDAWIMDGNFAGTFDLRMPRADALVWFDYPRLICLKRALWRVVKDYNRVRADLAAGCPERFDLEFLRYIWTFNAKERPRVVASLAKCGAHLNPVVFRRDADVARFLDGISC